MDDNRVGRQAYGADGMTEELLIDATAPDSPAKKLKKRPAHQSKPTPTQKDRRNDVVAKYTI